MIIRIGVFLTISCLVPLATALLAQDRASHEVEVKALHAAEGIGMRGAIVNDLVIDDEIPNSRGVRLRLQNSAPSTAKSTRYTVPVHTHAPYYIPTHKAGSLDGRGDALYNSNHEEQASVIHKPFVGMYTLPQNGNIPPAPLWTKANLHIQSHEPESLTRGGDFFTVNAIGVSEIAVPDFSSKEEVRGISKSLDESGVVSAKNAVFMLSPLHNRLRSYRNVDVEGTVEETTTSGEESSSDYSTAAISAAVGLPFAALGGAAYWFQQRRRGLKADSLEMDPIDHRIDTDFDEDSLGDTTEDPFEFKFEVGNDAAMWAHQADFSAF